LWQAVMGTNPSNFKGDNMPVENVSWKDCQEFIGKLNGLTNKKFRLPTEAEWEYAARGGNKSRGYKYAGSDSIDDVAWYDMNGEEITHPVASKQPNELGIYDMTGNVYEWCSDWYGIYTDEPQMSKAWQQICHHSLVTSTMDIWNAGIVFFNPHFLHQNYTLRL